MAFSGSGFTPRKIAGLPDALTTSQTQIISLLDQLITQLTIKTGEVTIKTDQAPTTGINKDIIFTITDDPSTARNNAFIPNAYNFLCEQQDSLTYQQIDMKLGKGATLSPEETLYYSLVSGHVTRLKAQNIKALQEYTTSATKAFTIFKPHINALYCGLLLHTSTNQNDRQALLQHLQKILHERDLQNNTLPFCNLTAIDFSGLELTNLTLIGLNFQNAIFEKCVILGVLFKDCSLRNADFSSTTTDTLETQGLQFVNCWLNNSKFLRASLVIHAKGCHFESANLMHATLTADFEGCNLQGCSFSYTTLHRSINPTTFDNLCLLNRCDLSTTFLSTPLNLKLNYQGLILFSYEELRNPEYLELKLTALMPKLQCEAQYLHDYRVMIVDVLLNQLKTNEITGMNHNEIVKAARTHDIFKTQNTVKWMCNQAATFCRLFPQAQVIKTKAEAMLEAALTPLPPSVTATD